jgi:hypothetical protein
MEHKNINDILGINKVQKQDTPESNNSDSFQQDSSVNKVLNITRTGGIIGLLTDSPLDKLNGAIENENIRGWKVVQIIPDVSGNLLLVILRTLILILTLFLYTPANGFYVIFEKIKRD